MASLKTRFVLLAISVIGLGITLGTALWLKLGPGPEVARWEQKPLEGLNRYGAVPDFVLVERSGKSMSLADLRGAVWIADFIYTSCQDTCPLQTAEMARLQEQLLGKTGVKLVSISVDPEKDTAQVLSQYAARYKADSDRWLFLTGAKDQITQLVQEGFRLSAGSVEAGVILHSPRFVLVDKETQIRGYYDSRDAEALQRLRKDVATLLNG
ncbi:MAG: SCO family protein [Candidatus Binatia bacterium]